MEEKFPATGAVLLASPAVLAWCLFWADRLRRWRGIRFRVRMPLQLRGRDMLFVVLFISVAYLLEQFAAGAAGYLAAEPQPLQTSDVSDWRAWTKRLREAGERGTSGSAHRLWEMLDSHSKRLLEAGDEPSAESKQEIIDSVNRLLYRPGLFRRVDFKDVRFADRFFNGGAPQLNEADPKETLLRNRRLLELAFKKMIEPMVDLPVMFLGIAIGHTLIAIGLALLLGRFYRVPLRQIGLHRLHWRSYFAFGLAQVVVWLPAIGLLNLLVRWGIPQQTMHPVAKLLIEGERTPIDWAIIAYSAVVAAPVLEEMIFRGLLQTWLVETLSAWPAIVGSALLFGLSHSLTWPDPIPLTVFGIGLGIVYQRTRSLWAPIALHLGFNGLMLAIGVFEARMLGP